MISGEKPDVRAAEKALKENQEVRTRLNADLQTGEFSQVYLLYGEETYLRRSYQKRFREKMVGDDDMNLTCYEGKDISPSEFMDMAETLPFFGERRLIICENTGWFSSARDELTEYLGRLPETTYVIFSEETADKRLRLFKKVNEIGYAAKLGYQTPGELKIWIARYVGHFGKKISERTAERIIDRCGIEMDTLSNELEKIIAYTGPREVVTESDVNAVTVERLEDRIFDMIDAVTSGNRKEALDLYADLVSLKEPPIKIMVLLGRQFYTLQSVRTCLDRGMGSREIGTACGLRFPDKMIRQARAFTRDEWKKKAELVLELDQAVKSGDLSDRLAVEMLLLDQN